MRDAEHGQCTGTRPLPPHHHATAASVWKAVNLPACHLRPIDEI